MDKVYKDLFEAIAKTTAITAEKALDYEHGQGNEDGARAAKIMRDDYSKLQEKIQNDEVLLRADYAKLLVGAWTAVQGLERQKDNLESAIKGYKIDTMPKLDRIVNETKTDEEAQKLAEEIFNS